jgi:hypothetical protein
MGSSATEQALTDAQQEKKTCHSDPELVQGEEHPYLPLLLLVLSQNL